MRTDRCFWQDSEPASAVLRIEVWGTPLRSEFATTDLRHSSLMKPLAPEAETMVELGCCPGFSWHNGPVSDEHR
ncbi:hypothetical protein SBA5_100081 [Candidatus Sulfotelmatomonas gaucii]|uniref:Uncharacterized protein n=1 Tax=Candidatus Sulfuritelmatomonas gaucii TaxID=2043161 RepID=A0A2N9L2X9_9BACT|nr:hypothetical protein SBA5_100081 [Candidatus Sulfotelmatomonas gaucii]